MIYNKEGLVDEVECTYDPKSKSGSGSEESKRKVKGTLHWVSSTKNIQITIREYDRLFEHASPGQFPPEEFYKILNPNSISVSLASAEIEMSKSKTGDSFQFQRKGYYIMDKTSSSQNMVFNKTVSLRDNWKKQAK